MNTLYKKIAIGFTTLALAGVVSYAPATTQKADAATISDSTLMELQQVLTQITTILNHLPTTPQSPVAAVDSNAAGLRVAMNNLFSEHVDVSADVMRDITDESDDLEASKAAQMDNAVEIAEAFGSLYGDDVETAVADAFVEHIMFSNEYAEAVDAMNEGQMEEANDELDEYLHDIAGLLASVIDTVDEETAYTVLREHEDLLNEAAEQYKDGDYDEAYETEREALKQIQTVSDVLSSGIVATMPEDF